MAKNNKWFQSNATSGVFKGTREVAVVAGPTGEFLPLAGGTMSGNIDMNGNAVLFSTGDQIQVNGSGALQLNSDKGIILAVGATAQMAVTTNDIIYTNADSEEITIKPAAAGGGRAFIIATDEGTAFSGTIAWPGIQASSRTWTFPDNTGTIALLSDIPVDNAGLYGGSGTVPTGVIASITDTLTFGDGNVLMAESYKLGFGGGVTEAIYKTVGGLLEIESGSSIHMEVGGDLTTNAEGIEFRTGGAFQTLIASTTPTANRTATLQDASGTIAYLSDITGGSSIYSADGTVGAARVATLTDSLTFISLGGDELLDIFDTGIVQIANDGDLPTPLVIGTATVGAKRAGIEFNSGYGGGSASSYIQDRSDGTYNDGMTLNSRDGIFQFLNAGVPGATLLASEIEKLANLRADAYNALKLHGAYIPNGVDDGIEMHTSDIGNISARRFSVQADSAGDPNAFFENIAGLGVGTPSPTAMLHVKGAGATSATTSILIEDTAGVDMFEIKDDGEFILGKNAVTHSFTSVAIGTTAEAKGTGSIALGNNTLVDTDAGGGGDGIAIGNNTQGRTSGIAIGTTAYCYATNISIGNNTGDYNTTNAGIVAIGNKLRPTGANSINLAGRNSSGGNIIPDEDDTFGVYLTDVATANSPDLKFRLGEDSWWNSAGSFGFGTITPDASSVLDLTSTAKGFLPPRMTTVEMEAIGSPVEGLLVWDNTTNDLKGYDGDSWVYLGGKLEQVYGIYTFDLEGDTDNLGDSGANTVPVITNAIHNVTNVYRVDPDAVNHLISGILAPPTGVNRVIHISNVSNSDDIKFDHDNSSVAANGILLRDGADKAIKGNETASFWYDHVVSRWKVFNRVG
jgi:hypothetical protein